MSRKKQPASALLALGYPWLLGGHAGAAGLSYQERWLFVPAVCWQCDTLWALLAVGRRPLGARPQFGSCHQGGS